MVYILDLIKIHMNSSTLQCVFSCRFYNLCVGIYYYLQQAHTKILFEPNISICYKLIHKVTRMKDLSPWLFC